ncbi:MAG: hypothetical protein II770_07470 [Bacteroidales bacterium]|nr:hypothetical protein [Bacteroidales bacterium]
MKKKFETPRVIREVSFQAESSFLGGSIVDTGVELISDGHKVENIDASSSEFDWNNNWTWGEGE